MSPSETISTDSKSTENQFSDEAMLRYRLAKAMQLAGNTELAKKYMDLLRLKEEMEQLIWDVVALERGRLIIYAVDDVVLRAYVEMDEDNRRSFSFPVAKDSYTDRQLDFRATEYAWRLRNLFFSKNCPEKPAPLLILPSAMPGLTQFAKYLKESRDKYKKKIQINFDEIIKQEPESIEHKLKELATSLRDQQSFGTKMERSPVGKEATDHLRDNLLALYQDSWNYEQTGKFIDLFKKLLDEGDFCYAHTGLSPLVEYMRGHFKNSSVDASIQQACKKLEPYLNSSEPYDGVRVDLLFQLLMETNKESVFDSDRKPESLWIAATNFGYLSVINRAFEDHRINAEVQLITHRQKLVNAVRALGWEKNGVPLRHPKFLAAALGEQQREDVVALANKVVIFLERMLGKIGRIASAKQGHGFSWDVSDINAAKSAIQEAQADIEVPWESLKSSIYLNEVTAHSKCQVISESVKSNTDNISFKRIMENAEKLLNLSTASMDYEGEYLVHQILTLWAKGQKVFIAYVPAFEKLEGEHIMVAPVASRMHYIVKIPTEFFDDKKLQSLLVGKAKEGMAFNEVDITEVVNAIHTTEPRLYSFARALCASVSGNWTLVEQLLKDVESDTTANNDNVEKQQGLMIQNQFLVYEGYHLRQFGLRGAATKAMTRKKLVALGQLNEAGKLLYWMAENINLDVRYQLARIGWNLEALSTLVEAGETRLDDEQIYQQYPSFDHLNLKEPKELVMDCIKIITTLSQRLKNDDKMVGNNKSKPSQVFYWHYMRSRAYQMIMMVMAATKANLVPKNVKATFALKYGHDRLYDVAKEGEACWNTALEQLDKLTDSKVTMSFIEQKFPAANFLYSWYKVQQMECSIADIKAMSSLEELQRARKCLDEIMGFFEVMENSCRGLSHTGYARRVFRRLKAVEYGEHREKLREIIFHTMTRLEQEAIRSYQNW